MARAATEHQVTALIGRCYAGLGSAGLRDEMLRRLRQLLTVDAAFFATVDPATLLFTSGTADEPLAAAQPLFLANEFGHADVSKFADLAEAADPVSSLDRETGGTRPLSPRYREIMGPLGLGDELRAALVTQQTCWGVMCLHREDAEHGFEPRELDLIRRVSPHIAEGLRRAAMTGPAAQLAVSVPAPGMIVLDGGLAVLSMSQEAALWLAEIDDPGHGPAGELPMPVYAAAGRLLQVEASPGPQPPASILLRSRAGRWMSLHAARLSGTPEPQIGVVISPAPADQVSSLLLRVHGLTDAQSRVAALLIRGHSTKQIVAELHISANTVQEHLTGAFDKFGVRSRRELVAAVLGGPR
jgi:DNA-binding CsgD family transcriptional regulator